MRQVGHAEPRIDSKRLHDTSEFMDHVRTAIEIAFADALKDVRWPSDYTEEEKSEDIAESLAREHAFADKVIAAANEAAWTAPGPVTLLFDIDETIVHQNTETGRDVVRPAFSVVVDALRSQLGDDRVEIGLLTSRGQSHLDGELDKPTYLQSVMGAVNRDFVVSARVGNGFGDSTHNNQEELRSRLGAFLDQTIITDDDIGTFRAISKLTRSQGTWTGSKLPLLKQFVDAHPGRSFVYVDDVQSASVVNPEYSPRLKTVQVYDDAAFWGIGE